MKPENYPLPYFKISDYFYPFNRGEDNTPARTAKKEAHQRFHFEIIIGALSRAMFASQSITILDKKTPSSIPLELKLIEPVAQNANTPTAIFYSIYQYAIEDVLFIADLYRITASPTTIKRIEQLEKDQDVDGFFSRSLNTRWFERSIKQYNEGASKVNKSMLFVVKVYQ